MRRSRRQKTAIKSLSKENARLRKAVRKSESRQAGLEVQLAKLRATGADAVQGAVRAQERAAGEAALEERTEERNPPADARVCVGCGKPYVTTGAEVSTIVEIEVGAHKRVIRRPRWRRRCNCASSPVEVSALPAPRLFAHTPCGTSVWARFLFERYACFRLLHRVASWLSGQGGWSYPVSVDSLWLSSPALRWATAGGRKVFSRSDR